MRKWLADVITGGDYSRLHENAETLKAEVLSLETDNLHYVRLAEEEATTLKNCVVITTPRLP